MSYIEIGFCDKEEYTSGRNGRKSEAEIDVNNLYTALFAMKRKDGGQIKDREAFKLPAKILDKEKGINAGLYVVRFAILDLELEQVGDCTMNLFDGFLTDPTNAELIAGDKSGAEFVANMGYFKTLEGSGNKTQETHDSAYIPSSELVLA